MRTNNFGSFKYVEGEEEMHIQEIYLFAHKLFAMAGINNEVVDKLTDKDMRLLKKIVKELQNIIMEVKQND